MEWRPVVGYEEIYEISEMGDVRSLDRTEIHPEKMRYGKVVRSFTRFRKGRIIRPNLTPKKNRLLVELNKNGIKRILIHRLVYESFIGALVDGLLIHHKDEDMFNNHYSNLVQLDITTHNNIHAHPAWNKGIENPRMMVENARIARESNYIVRCEETYNLQKTGLMLKQISILLNICEGQVSNRIRRFKEWKSRKTFAVESMNVYP